LPQSSIIKPSPLRHPVAIVRQICRLYQKEFAQLIGCSRIYLQKIEQTPQHGGQRLSEKLATRISHETGVSLTWLLTGDPNLPAVSGRVSHTHTRLTNTRKLKRNGSISRRRIFAAIVPLDFVRS